jgi:hypothetical protein
MGSPPISLIERRAHPRVVVELRCYTASGGSKPRVTAGRTINISRTGLLMLWEAGVTEVKTPKLGEVIKVDVELPASSIGRRCIRCRGQVVRVQMAMNRVPLIAVAVAQMDFRDAAGFRRIEGDRAAKKEIPGGGALADPCRNAGAAARGGSPDVTPTSLNKPVTRLGFVVAE